MLEFNVSLYIYLYKISILLNISVMEEVYIEKILFNDSQEFTFLPNDIIVFTGANNAGKSQILRDIKLLAEKDKASTIIIKNITLKKILTLMK